MTSKDATTKSVFNIIFSVKEVGDGSYRIEVVKEDSTANKSELKAGKSLLRVLSLSAAEFMRFSERKKAGIKDKWDCENN